AIFVTGLGALYTKYQNLRTEFKQNKEAVQKLDLEIEYRISRAVSRLESINQRKKTEPTVDITADIKQVLEELSKSREFSSLYPDYLNFSTVATVAELQRRLPEQERSPIDEVLAHLTGLYVLMEVNEAPLNDPKKIAGVLLEKIRLSRWSGRFYF